MVAFLLFPKTIIKRKRKSIYKIAFGESLVCFYISMIYFFDKINASLVYILIRFLGFVKYICLRELKLLLPTHQSFCLCSCTLAKFNNPPLDVYRRYILSAKMLRYLIWTINPQKAGWGGTLKLLYLDKSAYSHNLNISDFFLKWSKETFFKGFGWTKWIPGTAWWLPDSFDHWHFTKYVDFSCW